MNFKVETISDEWFDLGNVDDKICYFQDALIPERYIKEEQHGYFLKIDGKMYHFKYFYSKRGLIRELLGEKVTLGMGLFSVRHQLAKAKRFGKEQFGLLSPWAREENMKYESIESIPMGDVPLEDYPLEILNRIDRLFPKDPLSMEFRLFLVRDYFTQESDRKEDEILFARNDGTTHLGYLCDYEYEFFSSSKILNRHYLLDFNKDEVLKRILKDERLMLAFQKALHLSLEGLLSELKLEQNIRLSSQDMVEYILFEEEMKRKIRKGLKL